MKKLTVYNVYLDDGKSAFRVTVPAASKKEAADYVQGNGDVVAINPAPVPVVGLICWRCRWAWSALAPFPLSAFQRHGWRWRCSIRCVFAVCRRGQILHFTG